MNSSTENLEIQVRTLPFNPAEGKRYVQMKSDYGWALTPLLDAVMTFNTDPDWRTAPNFVIDILHELTHIYGTDDTTSPGNFNNAYTIDLLAVKGIKQSTPYKGLLNECIREERLKK